jgi:thiamine biosynthesis lipoprotein
MDLFPVLSVSHSSQKILVRGVVMLLREWLSAASDGRKTLLNHWLLPIVVVFWLCGKPAAADDFLFSHEQVLGTTLELTVTCADQHTAKQAEQRALEEIDRLAAIFSSYQTDSQFSRFTALAADQSMVVSPELLRLLKRCEEWTRVSNGAFNPAVEVISRRWQQAAVEGVEPTMPELQQLVSVASQRHWRVQAEQGRLIRRTEQPLTLNAIAKGTVVDSVVLALQSASRRSRALCCNGTCSAA